MDTTTVGYRAMTAYATERFKEVGIHKVLGAQKHQLVVRYLTESWLLAMCVSA